MRVTYKCYFYVFYNSGQEFDVLFLSTVESISSDGKPFDPLKSFCDPSVFNTAMTRARSLIVAVGNPETLITAERAMGSSYECWHKYIQKCRMNHTYRHHKMDTTHSDEIAPIVEKKPLILSGMYMYVWIQNNLSYHYYRFYC